MPCSHKLYSCGRTPRARAGDRDPHSLSLCCCSETVAFARTFDEKFGYTLASRTNKTHGGNSIDRPNRTVPR